MANIEISTQDALVAEGALDLLLGRDDLPDLWRYRIGKLAREIRKACDEYRAETRPIRVEHAKHHDDNTLVHPIDPETGEEKTGEVKYTPEGWHKLQTSLEEIQQEPVKFHGHLIPLSILQVEDEDGEKRVPPITKEVETPTDEEGVYEIKEIKVISGGQLITALMPLIEMDLEEE